MHIEPEEHSCFDISLAEQFRSKGYQCKELKEDEATVLIITHTKKKEEGPDHLPAAQQGMDKVNADTKA